MVSAAKYTPRGPNTLTLIFHDHFPGFAQSYDSLYAQDYGRFRLERISRVAQRFETCGDYTKGVARIQCSNPLGGSRATPPGAEGAAGALNVASSIFVLFPAKVFIPRAGNCTASARPARRNVPSCLPNTWTNNSCSLSRTGNSSFQSPRPSESSSVTTRDCSPPSPPSSSP